MGRKFELAVGMTVYLSPGINEARRNPDIIKEHVVKSIGRKFFYTWDGEREFSALKFRLEDFREENGRYSDNWYIHETEQEILDQRESNKLLGFFRHEVFRTYGEPSLTLDQLRRMKAIVEEGHVDEEQESQGN